MKEASASSDLGPGAVVGAYEIVAPISAGAMGAVYTGRVATAASPSRSS